MELISGFTPICCANCKPELEAFSAFPRCVGVNYLTGTHNFWPATISEEESPFAETI